MILIAKNSVTVVKTDIEGIDSPLLLEIVSKETKKKFSHKLDVDVNLRFVSFQIEEGSEYPTDETEDGKLRLLSTTYEYRIYVGNENNFNPSSELLKTGILKKI